MRVIFYLLLSVCSMLAFASDDLEIVVDATASSFSVPLPANPTTGFRWVVETYNKQYFNSPTEQYNASTPKRIGSGGQTVFTFEKKMSIEYPEKTKITFNYQRPWEPKQKHIMHVTVIFKNNSAVSQKK
jgi:inhibitor of cysteine peptidase